MTSWLDSKSNSMDMSLRKLWMVVKDRGVLLTALPGIAKSQIQLRTQQQQYNLYKILFIYIIIWFIKQRNITNFASLSTPNLWAHCYQKSKHIPVVGETVERQRMPAWGGNEAPPVGRGGLGTELEQQRRWTWAGWALKARLRFRSFC